jgi:hypothetical protein
VVPVRDLATRIPPDTRAELAAAAAVLTAAGPQVVAALEVLAKATTDAWFASLVPASLDPAEDADSTDEEWDALERVTGIAEGWRWALAIVEAADGVGVSR